MKKWMYLIFPGIGLGLFLVLYFAEVKKMEEKERVRAEEVSREKKADEERKAKLQQEANESAAKKAQERADELAKKEADKAAKWKAEGDKIQEETNKANAEAAASTKKIAELESQLTALHNQRDQANREYLDLIKAVELTKVDRRNAELEIQRMTKMIADKASDSSMARPPAPPAVVPAR